MCVNQQEGERERERRERERAIETLADGMQSPLLSILERNCPNATSMTGNMSVFHRYDHPYSI